MSADGIRYQEKTKLGIGVGEVAAMFDDTLKNLRNYSRMYVNILLSYVVVWIYQSTSVSQEWF